MFSAYWLSISEINLPKTVERSSENINGFLAKDAAIILTGLGRCSATCCCKFVSKNLFFVNRTSFIKNYLNVPKWNEMSLSFFLYAGFVLPVAIIAKCEEKIFLAQKNIMRKQVVKNNSPLKNGHLRMPLNRQLTS